MRPVRWRVRPTATSRPSRPTSVSWPRHRKRRSAPKPCAAWATWKWKTPNVAWPKAGAPAVRQDYRAAVQRYQEVLKAFPNAADNDRVLYQLARAHEQGGELDAALATLDRLVAAHPETRFQDEAQFRRGELLFTERKYPQAEKAYATVLASATRTPFHERSLYMQGWSQFKQGRLDEALGSFFGVLDAKLAGRDDSEPDLEKLPGLTRADRELVEDTFRVTSISLESLKGAETLASFINSDLRRAYEFRVHQQLAALYLKQDRTKDAADTLAQFARRQPLHAQAPQLQAQVIGIYQQAGFDSLALEPRRATSPATAPTATSAAPTPPAGNAPARW